MKKALLVTTAFAAIAVAAPSHAQKSKDTMRLAVSEPIRYIDGLFNAGVEGFLLDRVVQDNLLYWDTVEKKLKPQLATEWKRLNPNTLEFKLRQNVKFHDGSEFSADDVVYTFEAAMDPKYNFRLKETRYSYLKSIEKVDKYTVRIYVKEGSGVDLINIANQPPILPAAIHSKIPDKEKVEFGRATVGTGPYRLTQLDNNGIVLQKAATYTWGGSFPAGRIGTIAVSSIGDKQTQMAKVLVDELDVIFDVDLEQAKDVIAKKKNYGLYVSPTVNIAFTNFDTANRSGNSPFGDKRMREAVLAAIDRDALRKVFVPDSMKNEPKLTSMCHHWLGPCDADPAQKLPSYDPARAKKLLAEAGYPNGMDLEILTWAPAKQVAEAVAGDLRKVGIRTSVNSPARNVFTKLRGDGKAHMQVTIWDNSAGQPDIDATARYFFGETPQNYARDPELLNLVEKGRVELDEAKREQIYNRIFGKANEERYMSPIVQAPSLIIHSKDLVFDDANILYTQGFALNRVGWVK
jgi:peptide/nickel transport system substrate-binding protein